MARSRRTHVTVHARGVALKSQVDQFPYGIPAAGHTRCQKRIRWVNSCLQENPEIQQSVNEAREMLLRAKIQVQRLQLQLQELIPSTPAKKSKAATAKAGLL